MPSPQAIVTFVTVLFVMLVALHVPLGLQAVYSAATASVLALGAAWVVNRNVPDEDDDVTEDARDSGAATAAGDGDDLNATDDTSGGLANSHPQDSKPSDRTDY